MSGPLVGNGAIGMKTSKLLTLGTPQLYWEERESYIE